jgi:formylglycine-generating enzyme required for sulfatase activity
MISLSSRDRQKNVESPTLKVVINRHQAQNQFFAEVLTADLSLKMMQIPAGSFLMGSPPDELERSNSESPFCLRL